MSDSNRLNNRVDRNPLHEKLYRLLGDAGITDANMFTARNQVSWQALAEAPDNDYFEYLVRKQLTDSFCHTVGKRFLTKVSKDVYGKEWRMLGFVFNEEELITLLEAAYRLGRDDSVTPLSIGGILRDVREQKEAAIAAICSAPHTEDE